MITQVLHCPYCQGIDIVRHGKSPEGKQRYRCRQCREGSGRMFLLDGSSPSLRPVSEFDSKGLRAAY
jgi:transposase-like protein